MQVGGGNSKYRQHRAEVAKRALAREKSQRRVPLGILFAVTPERGRGSIPLIYRWLVYVFQYFSIRLAAVTSGGGSGRRGEQESPTHNQDAEPGEALQRASVQGYTDNRQRGAGILVLARAPEDEEHQELHASIGLK